LSDWLVAEPEEGMEKEVVARGQELGVSDRVASEQGPEPEAEASEVVVAVERDLRSSISG